MNKPLWVLDTNVVLDLLHFDDVDARPLLGALESGRARCIKTPEIFEELRRVLAYPEFELDDSAQTVIFETYQALSLTMETAAPAAGLSHKGTPIHYGLKPMWSRMPRCSDPDDQKFLGLAAASRAQLLVSKDRALLKLRRRCAPLFHILTPAEAVRWLHGVSQDSAAEI
ncbi:MAG: putative toxin-antitoxin system toxin component, PIN family [Thiobacillus sp.]